MKTLTLAVVVVVAGCDGHAYYVCSDNVFAEVRYDHQTDCDASRTLTALAKKLLSDSGLWTNPDPGGIPLTVVDAHSWRADAIGQQVSGMFYAVPGSAWMETDKLAISLVHEMFHAQDYLAVRLTNPLNSHEGWDANGRDALEGVWTRHLLRNIYCPVYKGRGLLPPDVRQRLVDRCWGATLEGCY